MMAEDPFVSVIIPVHNGARLVGRTLVTARSQTYGSLEIIVVDDGSTDKTGDIVNAAAAHDNRISYFRTENRGVAAARNFGISQAQGSLIAPLDHDDLWHPEKIARQVDVMKVSSTKVGLVYCWYIEIDEEDMIIPSIKKLQAKSAARGRVTEELARGCFIETGSSPLIKRSYIDAVGGYDATLRPQGADDWKLYFALSEICEFEVVPEYLVGYRQARGSISRNLKPMSESMENVASWIFERRPDLAKKCQRQTIRGIRAFMAQRALDNHQFGAAFSFFATAHLAEPSALLDFKTVMFAARFAARLSGLGRSSLRKRRTAPRVSFSDFKPGMESRPDDCRQSSNRWP
jgi:glycosyltransferase involved in cell wall biosynthesis